MSLPIIMSIKSDNWLVQDTIPGSGKINGFLTLHTWAEENVFRDLKTWPREFSSHLAQSNTQTSDLVTQIKRYSQTCIQAHGSLWCLSLVHMMCLFAFYPFICWDVCHVICISTEGLGPWIKFELQHTHKWLWIPWKTARFNFASIKRIPSFKYLAKM